MSSTKAAALPSAADWAAPAMCSIGGTCPRLKRSASSSATPIMDATALVTTRPPVGRMRTNRGTPHACTQTLVTSAPMSTRASSLMTALDGSLSSDCLSSHHRFLVITSLHCPLRLPVPDHADERLWDPTRRQLGRADPRRADVQSDTGSRHVLGLFALGTAMRAVPGWPFGPA